MQICRGAQGSSNPIWLHHDTTEFHQLSLPVIRSCAQVGYKEEWLDRHGHPDISGALLNPPRGHSLSNSTSNLASQ